MDMEFTAKLYLTTAEFDGAMSGKFREAVQAALGTAVSLQDVTVLGTAASAGHARKSETVTVTTKVALKAGTASQGTSSSPGLKFAQFSAALISKGVTSTVPSAGLPAGWGARFPQSLFADRGSLLYMEVTRYADAQEVTCSTCNWRCAAGFYLSSSDVQLSGCAASNSLGQYPPSAAALLGTPAPPGQSNANDQ